MEPLAVRDFRLDVSLRAFNFTAPTVWNTLPIDVMRNLSSTVSKTELNTFLFDVAYSK